MVTKIVEARLRREVTLVEGFLGTSLLAEKSVDGVVIEDETSEPV